MNSMYASTFVAFVIAVATICTGFMDMVGEEVYQAEPFSEMIGGGSFSNAIQISPEGYNDEDPLGNLPVYHYCYLQRQLIGRHGYRARRGIGSLRPAPCVDIQDIHEPPGQKISGSAAGNNHTAIFINGNDDFTAENGVTGGSGTIEDPYIIEDWVIVGDGSSTAGVCIKNTTAFFVIRNCSISNFSGEFSAGIYFNNVTAGKIEHIDAFKNDYGMTIQYSSFIDIVKSVCRDNFDISATGINIYRSHHITIDDCQIYRMTHPPPQDLTHGIWVEGSWNCRINNTICHSNSGYGILLHLWEREYPLQNNTIENCTI